VPAPDAAWQRRKATMQPPWLAHYPPGIPAEVDVNAYASLAEVLRTTCERFAERPAYCNMDHSITYAALDRASRDFAAYLQQAVGLHKGDRVALMMPNLLQYPVALFGVLRAGLVVVNVNPQYTVPELEHQLLDSGAVAIVVLENFARTVQEVLERNPKLDLTVITTEVGDMFPVVKELLTNVAVKYLKKMVPDWRIAGAIEFNATLRGGRALALTEVPLGPGDTAFLQYTGGTTGVAKGAVLTHGNLVANLQQVGAWIAGGLRDGAEVFVCPLPLYHVFALTASLVFFKIGAHNILVTNPRDLPALIGEFRKHDVTVMIGVNTLYRALLDAPQFAAAPLRHMKLCCAGGMAVQRVVAERWKAATGVPLIEGYGLTETSPIAISNPIDLKEWSGNIGMPIPSTLAAIFDENDNELPAGAVGEICVRGPQVMAGYWNRPDETRGVFNRHGWLRTGDMGFVDERGQFKITDRIKDMIVVSGFKVFPNQIEDVVAQHDGVAEVAAIGAPDEKSGEVVKIIVVRKDTSLSAQALLAHCRQHLTGYKMPKIVEFREQPLPKSNLGKILRRLLRDAQGDVGVVSIHYEGSVQEATTAPEHRA
jgi:long-chain acyl-CoA synthetase